MTTASIFTNFWGNLEDNHEQAVFLVLVGFLGSFAFIRMSTRIIRSESVSWWPGNVESESGVHLHHLVFGIVTMMVAGTLGFASDGRAPFTEICALLFGIGVGLTIDEYALWVHLEDVYWAEEGRSSVDATVIAAALMLLIVLGVSPVVIDSSSTEALITSIILTFIAFLCVAICFAKGRILHGTVGIFVAPVAFYGAARIGKPRSAWARYRYGERRPKKQAKAADRFAPARRTERFKEAFRDVVGGKPSEGLTAISDEAVAATREASAEVREQAERLAHAADPREKKEQD
jgi:hypothetical protein